MEISANKIPVIGLFKNGTLEAVIVQNGKPTHYEVSEMDNRAVERLYEVDRMQVAKSEEDL